MIRKAIASLICVLASVVGSLVALGYFWPVWGEVEVRQTLAFFYSYEDEAGFWLVEFDRPVDTKRLAGVYRIYAEGGLGPMVSQRFKWRERSPYYVGIGKRVAYRKTTWIAGRSWAFAATAAILALPIALWGPLRCHRRRKRNQCIHCGYRLTGLVEARCPECGTACEQICTQNH